MNMDDSLNKAEILRRLGYKQGDIDGLSALELLNLDENEVTHRLEKIGYVTVRDRVEKLRSRLGLNKTSTQLHAMTSVVAEHDDALGLSDLMHKFADRWRITLPAALTMATLVLSVSLSYRIEIPPTYPSSLAHDLVQGVTSQLVPLNSNPLFAPISKNSSLPEFHPAFSPDTFLVAANTCRECHLNVFPD